MIRYINLTNFRAYRSQRFDFSKINIFLGPNNSGKSSVLSALNMLAQTVKNRRGASSPIMLNGLYEQLGTYTDCVHGNISRSRIGIEFGYHAFDVSFEVKYRSQRREIDVTKFSLSHKSRPVYGYVEKKDSFETKILGKDPETFLIDRKKTKPRFDYFWPYDREFGILRFRNTDDQKNQDKIREFYRYYTDGERALSDLFAGFDSLSPFREQPQRTYLYSGETPNVIGRTGENGVNILVNDNSRRGSLKVGILDHINEWFSVTGIAREVKVKNLTPRHFEVCVVDFKGREHNICDVGFGCSQVLPVLVGGLNMFLNITPAQRRRPPIFVIQEPEIHLHPNAQAALGSYFVGLSAMGGQLFLETHSDHLVLRIARHVARGDIAADDVRIYYIRDTEGEREIFSLGFNSKGAFSPEWPGGFLPQRQTESLALARDRLGPNRTERQMTFPYLEA